MFPARPAASSHWRVPGTSAPASSLSTRGMPPAGLTRWRRSPANWLDRRQTRRLDLAADQANSDPMFVTFFTELKQAGVPVTLREYLTLVEAMEADLASRRV